MTPAATETENAYEPNAAQLERAAAWRRFNRFYIYTPIALIGLAAITLVALLFWGALSPGITGTRQFASSLADIVIILAIIPSLLLCAIGPIGAIGIITLYWRRRPQQATSGNRLQMVLWRLGSLLDKVLARIKEILPRVAKPIIEGNAKATYMGTLVKRFIKIFSRS